jgi:hypothetical protein
LERYKEYFIYETYRCRTLGHFLSHKLQKLSNLSDYTNRKSPVNQACRKLPGSINISQILATNWIIANMKFIEDSEDEKFLLICLSYDWMIQLLSCFVRHARQAISLFTVARCTCSSKLYRNKRRWYKLSLRCVNTIKYQW